MVVRWGKLVMITNFTKKNVKIKTTVRFFLMYGGQVGNTGDYEFYKEKC